MTPEPTFADAPASVTYTIKSKDGFEALFSVRDTTGITLLEKMEVIERTLLAKGYQTVTRGYGKFQKPEPKPEGTCPDCGGKTFKKVFGSGKSVIECENRKYDFKTKQNMGSCNYVKWE